MPGRTAKTKRKPAKARRTMTAAQLTARGKKAAATRARNQRAKTRGRTAR